jgi:hypothetical protein
MGFLSPPGLPAPAYATIVVRNGREEEQKTCGFTLPCAGIIRTGTKGVISPSCGSHSGRGEDP